MGWDLVIYLVSSSPSLQMTTANIKLQSFGTGCIYFLGGQMTTKRKKNHSSSANLDYLISIEYCTHVHWKFGDVLVELENFL